MASQHIEITGTETRLAGDLRQLVDQLQRTVNHASQNRLTGNAISDFLARLG